MFDILLAPLARHRIVTAHMIGAPAGKQVQVWVYSFRAALWFPQAVPSADGAARVVLGDERYRMGGYKVCAVALDGKSEWEPTPVLPAGQKTPVHVVVRFNR